MKLIKVTVCCSHHDNDARGFAVERFAGRDAERTMRLLRESGYQKVWVK